MFEIILIITAFIGSVAAGIIDLKTTEIPDQIPYAMAAIGILLHGAEAFSAGSYTPVVSSFVFGLGFLAVGFLMYYTGQWGGGDAKLLSAIGFLLPSLPLVFTKNLLFPFPISFFFNLFLVGAVYMLGYAVFLSFKNTKIWKIFFSDLKANAKMFTVINIFMLIGLFALGLLTANLFYPLTLSEIVKSEVFVMVIIVGLFLVWRFTKTVEDIGFKRRITVSKLREGDVLLESKIWEGLTTKQVEKIKKSRKRYVWIKEGVRFGMAFPLALLFTFFVGDGIVLFLTLF